MSLTPLPRFLLPTRARVRIVLMAVLAALALGTVVFHLVEGWSILDSLYVTVQTLTTVGYGDIAPQTALGQALAALLMITGYGIIAVPTGIVTLELQRASAGPRAARECPGCGSSGHDADASYCKYCGTQL